MKYKILIVDDEQANLRLLDRVLSPDYDIVLAESGTSALDILARETIALIITDQRMPGMTGIDFLKRAAAVAPNSVRIVVTGYTDAEALVEAINSGVVYKYVTKPWINSDFKITVQRALQHHEAQRAQRNLQERYTKVVNEADEARASFRNLVGALLQLQDPDGYDRAMRVISLATDLAQVLELRRTDVEKLQLAIFVRAILISGDQASSNAIGNSVDHALEALRKFESGIEVISEIPLMHEVVIAVKQFGEKYDGSGYPSQLFGESITMIARIGALVTAYDEMSFPLYDEPQIEPKTAIEKIQNAAGIDFDPMMVDIFCSLIEAKEDNEPQQPSPRVSTESAVSLV
jgi:adenylate cyclase